jgi:membrane-bound metal-dependent hydrolase YbcI (DUF457 family)
MHWFHIIILFALYLKRKTSLPLGRGFASSNISKICHILCEPKTSPFMARIGEHIQKGKFLLFLYVDSVQPVAVKPPVSEMLIKVLGARFWAKNGLKLKS